MVCQKFNYTPTKIAEKLLEDVDFQEDDSTLECCAGDNAFYDLIPFKKDWCEIERGRDFFECTEKYTKVITNPPYKDLENKKNIFIPILEQMFKVCTGEVWILINLNMFNSLTPIRLTKYHKLGFNITFLRILNIDKWYGRYYWIQFSKNDAIIMHSLTKDLNTNTTN